MGCVGGGAGAPPHKRFVGVDRRLVGGLETAGAALQRTWNAQALLWSPLALLQRIRYRVLLWGPEGRRLEDHGRGVDRLTMTYAI